ncbi:hypothetical protein QR680_010065 [Steinernema hermaphroditum]|uniref:Uncharacterized protein n=1 Tax=Steinernema hermaphroditum TaxID=289476 RepID=A0AA39INV3_9BILA|nr:hypothetical protein QR680_010065 [Steinernema hermaphroditum]
MLRSVAVAEYIIAILCSILSTCLVFLIFKRRSLSKTWSDSEPMALLFISILLTSLASIILSVQWMLVSLELISDSADNTWFLLIGGLFFVVIQLFYVTATLGVFTQRIFIVLFPYKCPKKFDKFILAMVLTISLSLVVIVFTGNIVDLPRNVPPFSNGCLAFNCSNILTRIYGYISIICLSIVTLSAGILFQVLFIKWKGTIHKRKEEKLNNFARYAFFSRVLFETTPFVIDVVLNAFDIRIGNYVGTYGMLGGVFDMTLTTILYYTVVVRKTYAAARTQVSVVNTTGPVTN